MKDNPSMAHSTNTLAWLTTSGTPFEIGAAMGAQGRDAVHQHLIHSPFWAQMTADLHAETVTRLKRNTQSRFPEFYEELRGLAAGLQLDFDDVFAWNCRGDILASTPDGCTSLQSPGDTIQISHNEDGLPFFRGHCFILEAKPETSTGLHAFCYPGSIAGHAFGWNEAGLVQAVNNLRLQQVVPEIPRMVLGRAVLASNSLQGAISVLSEDPCSGGFHMSLAQAGQAELVSVEYGGGDVSVVEITNSNGHANHALHMPAENQIITQSSADRQSTLERLLQAGKKGHLDILRDTSGPGLPIRRDAEDDPDEENTLATGLFSVTKGGVDWKIYADKTGEPTYQGNHAIT